LTKADLETRIADAIGADLSSKQFADLLAEVVKASEEAKAASASANEIALDPSTRPEDVSKARKDMEDASFRQMRMERAAAKLEELKGAARRKEEAAVRNEQRKQAIETRDQMVKDLAEYEELSTKITNLLVRLEYSNSLVDPFETAEAIARGAEERWLTNFDESLPRLLDRVRLPKFRRDDNYGYLWPKRQRY
jgi:hypothetical protein